MLLAWLGVVIAVTALDVALAASPRRVHLERDVPPRVRLGEPVESTLFITNESRRRITGIVRDAWQPSAGARPNRQRVTIPGHERRAITTTLIPVRRGHRRAEHVTIRSLGPLRIAARQATIRFTGAITVLPPFTARKHLPSRLARLRELDGRTSV